MSRIHPCFRIHRFLRIHWFTTKDPSGYSFLATTKYRRRKGVYLAVLLLLSCASLTHFEKNQENSLALQKIIITDMHLSCVAAVMEEQQHVRSASQSILQQRNVVMAARSSSLHTAGTGPFASFQKLRRLGVEVNLKVNCNKYLHSLYSRSLLAWMYCIFPLEQLSAYHTRALKTSSLSSPNCCCFRKIHPGRKTAMYFEHIIFFCNHTPFQLHCLKHRHCYKHLLVA